MHSNIIIISLIHWLLKFNFIRVMTQHLSWKSKISADVMWELPAAAKALLTSPSIPLHSPLQKGSIPICAALAVRCWHFWPCSTTLPQS